MTRILIVLIIFLLGALFGSSAIHYTKNIQFEDKLNVVDLATLLVTIFLAFYIPSILEKKLHNRRYEKETNIKKLEEIQGTIKDINIIVKECYRKNSISKTNERLILSYFTTLSNQIKTFINLVSICHSGCFIPEISNLRNARKNYKDCITGGGFQTKGYVFSSGVKNEEERLFQDFDKQICELIIKINKR